MNFFVLLRFLAVFEIIIIFTDSFAEDEFTFFFSMINEHFVEKTLPEVLSI